MGHTKVKPWQCNHNYNMFIPSELSLIGFLSSAGLTELLENYSKSKKASDFQVKPDTATNQSWKWAQYDMRHEPL